MARPGPRTINRHSNEFKAGAVRLSQLPGVQVQEVAKALAIHPYMLSRWRMEAREGKIVMKKVVVDPEVAAELKELRAVHTPEIIQIRTKALFLQPRFLQPRYVYFIQRPWNEF